MKPWQPKPVRPPVVDIDFSHMSSLQRAGETFRYNLLCWEHWASPKGNIRAWLRLNFIVFAWLIIPVVFVMPIIDLVLSQLTGWLTMLTTITGKLIVLPILFLLVLIVLRIVALLKR